MSRAHAAERFRVLENGGRGDRLWLRARLGDRVTHIGASGYRGPALPEPITNPELELSGKADGRSWRLNCDQGSFDFEASAVERIVAKPGLYAGLHRPFGLKTADRLAVRLLLVLLRLPGGARILRRWHARRSS